MSLLFKKKKKAGRKDNCPLCSCSGRRPDRPRSSRGRRGWTGAQSGQASRAAWLCPMSEWRPVWGCNAPAVRRGSHPHGSQRLSVGPSEHFKPSSVDFGLSSHPCLGQAWFEVRGTGGESVPLGAVAEGVDSGRVAAAALWATSRVRRTGWCLWVRRSVERTQPPCRAARETAEHGVGAKLPRSPGSEPRSVSGSCMRARCKQAISG